MSGRKNVLTPWAAISKAPMDVDQTSPVINIQYLDNVSMQLIWNDNASGNFFLEASLNYNERFPNDATWTPVTLSPVPVATGTAGNILMDLNQLSFPFIRVIFETTDPGSTALLDVYISAKML